MTRDVAVVIPAGGAGQRMGGVRKQYTELAGRPMLLWTLAPFLDHPRVGWIVIALPESDTPAPPGWLSDLDPRVALVPGGAERRDSVHRGLEAVAPAARLALIHDAARPLITAPVIDRVLQAIAPGRGAIAALPVRDTVKEVDADRVITRTPERGKLWLAQTPQGFERELILAAYRQAIRDGVAATDDAAVAERAGDQVVVVEGDPENFKVTTPTDLALAEAILRRRAGSTPDRSR